MASKKDVAKKMRKMSYKKSFDNMFGNPLEQLSKMSIVKKGKASLNSTGKNEGEKMTLGKDEHNRA